MNIPNWIKIGYEFLFGDFVDGIKDMPNWMKIGLLLGTVVWIVVNVFGSSIFWIIGAILIVIIIFSILNNWSTKDIKHNRMYPLLKRYENSNIGIPHTLAYLGGRVAALAIERLNLALDKKDQSLLEILFTAILFHHFLGVLKVNHMGSIVENKEFKEEIVDDTLSIIKSENQSMPTDIKKRLWVIFRDYFGKAVINMPLESNSYGSLQVAEFIIKQMHLNNVDKHTLDRIISLPLKEFNLATAYRIEKSLSV